VEHAGDDQGEDVVQRGRVVVAEGAQGVADLARALHHPSRTEDYGNSRSSEFRRSGLWMPRRPRPGEAVTAAPRRVLAAGAAIAGVAAGLAWITVLVMAARSGSTGAAPAVTSAVAALLAVHAVAARRG